MPGATLLGMATWQEFSRQAPGFAERVRARFDAAASHVLATVRRDGSPRVSGSEVRYAGPHMYIGSMLDARKAQDLRRDRRFALHAFPSAEGDAKVAGAVVEVTDQSEVDVVQGDVQPCHLFRLDLTEAVMTEVEGNTLVITVWHPGAPPVRYERPDNGPVVRIES
ncbi:pyridoxamine 5'-phosphate oxidase [Amycolatopsis bartoniae]|uniref:Pyridoxamine 5'-phosphate oxidase n=1 Tax=Amycolatopsis bartoniae TaxID=941986 RepID=A0A8H9MCR0_9PSEU|nr:pyridoxamine 5'-phosphate oxidase [Amycolatopsis bartoniae]